MSLKNRWYSVYLTNLQTKFINNKIWTTTFLAEWFQIRRADAAPSGLRQPVIISDLKKILHSSLQIQ